jgi:SAM-dependent methyltransferase
VTAPTPADFDDAFAQVIRSRALNAIMRAGFPDLPAWLDSYDFVPASELDLVAAHLDVGAGGTFLDLACGLGGPGLWLAERTGARVVGVDFSAVGVTHARGVAAARGIDAAYVAARGDALPVADGTVDAVVCLDALAFLPGLALDEIGRVTKPGGRLVVTAWERDVALGERPPIPDFGAAVAAGGLRTIAVERHDEWLDGQRRVYEEAIRRVAAGSDEPAARFLAEEGEEFLSEEQDERRVLVVAEVL